MPQFSYTFRDSQNRLITAMTDAESESVLVRALRDRNIRVLSIKAAGTGLNSSLKFEFKQKPSVKQVSLFSRQMATLLESGVPLIQSLAIMQRQSENRVLRSALGDVRSRTESGEQFSDALAYHPRIFDRFMVNLVRAGEQTGGLESVLERIAIVQEKQVALRGKLKSAMTYPLTVMGFALAITYFLLTRIVPQFGSILTELGGELPPLTKGLLALSYLLQHQGWVFGLALFVGVMTLRQMRKTKGGNRMLDQLLLKLPVFGVIQRKAALANFARTLATLLQSGVRIIEALEITREGSTNVIMEEVLYQARGVVLVGETMSSALAASPLFPAMVVSMAAIGEETGSLDTMMGKVADFYEREVDEAVEALSAMIEPLMIVVLGSIVGAIVGGTFMPMFSIIGKLSA